MALRTHSWWERLWYLQPLLWLLLPEAALAQAGLPAFTSAPGPGGGTTYTVTIQAFLLLTAITFLPAALLMMTAFTRIIIVLALLRQALGTVQAPPNQALIGLALFLTFFVMAPVFDRIYSDAYQPYAEQKIEFPQALERAALPLREFMLRQTRETDLALFIEISGAGQVQGPDEVPMKTLVPAFVISELKTAFQIGFIIFIPFLIIDMVVASVLMSMGMVMLSPVIVSLPFKLMLFVLVDGWNLLVASLVGSFNP
jgi:flagellar biosynthesis protein FliP